MPRSSKSKSRKHSSKVSGSDEDVKEKERSSNGGKEDSVSVRVSGSSERRKHSKDLNGDVCDEYTNTNSSKRREEKSEKSDRWNGGSSDEKGVVVNIENKEVLKLKDFSKVVGESKSKSSRRHDGDSGSVMLMEKDSGNRGEKRKLEKESSRKESSQYKENKESKEKDRGTDRGRKGHSDKVDKVEGESSLKQVENQSSKRGKEITEWPIEEELRNPELEKELEKRMRRRGEGLSDKDKYHDDIKEPEDRRLSRSKDETYEEVVRETRQRDEKHREDSERDRKRYTKHRDDKFHEDKHIEDANKDIKYKDEKYHEIGDKDERKHRQDEDRDYRHKEDKHREVRYRDDTDREKRARDSKYSSRDHPVEPDAKRLRDDNVATDLFHRKTNNRDGSPVDRVSRYKDDKDRRRVTDKDESSEYRSRGIKEQRSESEKRDSVSERGRLSSRYPARDHHRVSKQEETKYRDYAYEDRARHNVHSSRDYVSAPGQQSDKKVTSKNDSYMVGDLSGERRARPEVDKSPSSTSNERRNLTRSDARKSLDLEESGLRNGGSKDTVKDGKGSREDNDFSQVDNDNLSVSSPYTRNINSHFSGNSKSLLPPPSPSPSTFRAGSDSPFFGSTEDERNKSNSRHRRMVDQNMGRISQGNNNNWKNVPNWPSPMAPGGYINHPFQHVPSPMFHPLMQQFPPPIFGRPPMKLNPGLPYHVPDHCPPPLHNWDTNNAVFGDESHLYGRVDWDRRTQLNNRGWDQSGEMWKNQNVGAIVDVQTGQQKDAYSSHRPNDETWSGQMGPPDETDQNQMDIQTETLYHEKNAPEAEKVTESPQILEAVKKENNKALIVKAYLSRVDVSQDLTQPEVYEQCTSMMDLEQESLSDEFDCKILFIEDDVEANVTDSGSLFAAINDSVFQKAMFLYKKQKEELVTNSHYFVPPVDEKKEISDDESKPENEESCIQKVDTEEANVNDDEPNKPEEPMGMEVDDAVVVKQEEEEPPELTVAAVEEPCKVEEGIESTNDEKNDDDGGLVLSDVSNADVAVMPTESIEFGSVSLNRIHHHSTPESTH